jgi:hypothetical protein
MSCCGDLGTLLDSLIASLGRVRRTCQLAGRWTLETAAILLSLITFLHGVEATGIPILAAHRAVISAESNTFQLLLKCLSRTRKSFPMRAPDTLPKKCEVKFYRYF